ncbi:hypothetical protein [Amycolatopsis anabasis]|uniref:hypothetical protein n=1 Tax=Amycolatopsis anabasis TaxID=1840409 RepID=UPI00131C23E8|nr:hypothetical protein [Amycolatopsis anabasis]
MPETMRDTVATQTFAELVCQDPAWLRAEFDAIVAANFPASPPGDGHPPRVAPRPHGSPAPAGIHPGVRPIGESALPARRQSVRQRSPPRPARPSMREVRKGR